MTLQFLVDQVLNRFQWNVSRFFAFRRLSLLDSLILRESDDECDILFILFKCHLESELKVIIIVDIDETVFFLLHDVYDLTLNSFLLGKLTGLLLELTERIGQLDFLGEIGSFYGI